MNISKGRLSSWKDDKGFGFIKPESGTADVFVHTHDFGNIHRHPRVGDVVFYQAIQDKSGKLRAAEVRIEEGLVRQVAEPVFRHHTRPRRGTNNKWSSSVVTVLIVSTAFFLFQRFTHQGPVQRQAPVHREDVRTASPFACEGKTHCS